MPLEILKYPHPVLAQKAAPVGEMQIRDPADGDFRLVATSPLVNAGTNLTFTVADLDLDRRPRIFNFGGRNGLVDIGCYESQAGAGILFLVR